MRKFLFGVVSVFLFIAVSGCGGTEQAIQATEPEKMKLVDVLPIQKQKESTTLSLMGTLNP